jgi:hypothetical protein
MSPSEIITRIADIGRHAFIFIFLRNLQNYVPVAPASATALFVGKEAGSFVDGRHIAGGTLERVCADQWLDHQANFLSLKDIPLGEIIDWNCNYSTGLRGPLKYSGLIDHRNSALTGDVKYVWELNRLQHLVLLALAFNQSGNAAYGEEIVRQTSSWISSNPFMIGLNWKSPLEAAIRLISWALVSYLAGNRLPETFHSKLKATVYQHQYFIVRFYSKHSSANNHLIGEMTGLYIASAIWPFYKESTSWRVLAKKSLIREAMRQVGSDGVGRELATEYHLFILEFLILAGALGQIIGDPFPQEFWRRLTGMITFLSAISDKNGNLPIFGDGDSGQVVALPETLQSRVQNLLWLSRRPCNLNARRVASDTRSKLLLWGQGASDCFCQSEEEADPDLPEFPIGGYYVLTADRGRDAEMMVVFDAGPLGLAPLYAHGHADALSFWLSYGGQEFLIDPGTFSYHGHAAWRAYFRGTAAHNTIRVDGQDQSVPAGGFQWSQMARCQIEHTQNTEDSIELEASHDGYKRLPDPVIHRRRMRLLKKSKRLLIFDRLECARSHEIEIFFHFHEHCQLQHIGANAFGAQIEDRQLVLKIDNQLSPSITRGAEKPILGWVSRTYGVKTPAPTLIGRTKISGASHFLTEIAIS